MHICDEMLKWIRGLHQGSDIDEVHYEQDSAPAGGISHSILMMLRPMSSQDQYLPTPLAFGALRTFRSLVVRYGALHGGFQIWEDGAIKGIIQISIIKWGPAQAVDEA